VLVSDPEAIAESLYRSALHRAKRSFFRMAAQGEREQTEKVDPQRRASEAWRAPAISRISLDRTLSVGGSNTDGSASDPGLL
jgi:hypothetical protein